MLYRRIGPVRSGAVVLESAIIYPVVFLLILGLIIGGLGVFRYQEVAWLAREATRYACVHGTQYAKVTGKPAATATDIYNNAIAPNIVCLNVSQLSYSVTWNPNNSPGSTVSVNVSYHWVPEAFLPAMNMSSTSSDVMAY
jgi:Flp pilus assembly protein TadG